MRRYFPRKPSRQEIRAALDVYRPLVEGFTMQKFGKPGTCWAMVKGDEATQKGNELPCPVTAGVQEYEVQSRMNVSNVSGVTPGPVARMWLCAKHAALMKRRGYTLRK